MPRSAEEDISVYQKVGVEAMELCEAKFPKAKAERRELVSRIRDSDIAVSSVQAEAHSIFPDRMAKQPARPEDRLEAFKRSIDFWSQELESEGLPFVLIAGVPPDQNFRSAWEQARRWIRDAAAFAESRGARIAFEPLGPSMMYFDTFIYGLDQGARLIDAAESESVGLVVDAWHVWEEHDLERRLCDLASRTLVAHACDWPKGGPRCLDDRVLPRSGVIPLRDKIFGPLRAGGYRGPFTLEVLSDESLQDSLWKEDPMVMLDRAKLAMASY
ncbi:sugar phosphate isomerase/epimerase family protein [Pelagicoccus sp. SDUM812003]|uniref:sugar phosphate isomerase/epimerase family protein n=1 Tax=Pelagicoccus sp. SDUM812003 TaxID=3041267 RepID=UPI00280F7A85|nr:sugar phosphate isomerase/epimerase family protein [Pelagicoccus sp. SDUM812003]MDQ8204328.1 sugar phosphate isomerase/epimerase [Pelagicoccus sp. SDUM812003]